MCTSSVPWLNVLHFNSMMPSIVKWFNCKVKIHTFTSMVEHNIENHVDSLITILKKVYIELGNTFKDLIKDWQLPSELSKEARIIKGYSESNEQIAIHEKVKTAHWLTTLKQCVDAEPQEQLYIFCVINTEINQEQTGCQTDIAINEQGLNLWKVLLVHRWLEALILV